MTSILPSADVNNAAELRGIEHPVLTLFNRYEGSVSAFHSGYVSFCASHENDQERHRFVNHSIGFLADGIEQLGTFPVDPLSLIAIWAKMNSFEFQTNEGYAMTKILGHTYASIPLETRAGTTKFVLENGEFPNGLFTSDDEISAYGRRLDDIAVSLREIEFYKNGSRQTMSELREQKDTPEGKRAMAAAIRRETELSHYDLLVKIRENCTNSLGQLRMMLEAD